MKRKIMLAVAASVVALLPVMAQAANKLIVNGTDGVTPKFVVTDTGNIGIGTGTSSANYPLTVKNGGSSAGTSLMFHSTGNTTWSRWDSPGLNFMRNNISTENGGLPKATDRLGYFVFGSMILGSYRALANVQAYAESDATTTSAPVYLSFDTNEAGKINANERMRITSSGNIGIATKTPTQRLEVNGGVRLNPDSVQPGCDSTTRGTIWVVKGAVGVADIIQLCVKDANENYSWKSL